MPPMPTISFAFGQGVGQHIKSVAFEQFDSLQFADVGFAGIQPFLNNLGGPLPVMPQIERGHVLPVQPPRVLVERTKGFGGVFRKLEYRNSVLL